MKGGEARTDDGMDGEREELALSVRPARTCWFGWTTTRASRAKLFTARSCVQKLDGETRGSIIK